MPKDRQPHGPCEQCSQGKVTCTHNYFSDGRQAIDSWEHRCGDCSFRETEAYKRPLDETLDVDPKVCPYCGRHAPEYD